MCRTETGGDPAFRALLVAPIPPPMGGIARWAALLLDWVSRRAELDVRHVDVSTRWRDVHELGILRRAVGGGLQLARDYGRIKRACLGHRPQVVHLTTSGSLAVVRDLLVTRLGRRLRIPVFLHVHMGRLPAMAANGGWEWKLFVRAAGCARRILVLDERSGDALRRRLPHGQIQSLPNAIDVVSLDGVEPVRAGSNAPEVVLYVGYLVAHKGVVDLVQAWVELREPISRLCLIGPGDPEIVAELRRLARANGCDERLEIIGELPNEEVLRWMARCDVFVLPSHSEGFPMVILEAMALARAIVASDVGAIPEMLGRSGAEACGLIVPPRSVNDLREALRKVLKNKPLRERLGGLAGVRVRHEYDVERVFDQCVRAWREVERGELRRE